jgi:hypothetical protein
MRQIALAFITFTLAAIRGYGQKPCDITAHYEDFISVQKTDHKGKSYLTKRITKAQNETCFSALVNSNPLFIDYLLTNYSSSANSQAALDLTDSIAMRTSYFGELRRDSSFNAVMQALLQKAILRKSARDTVSMSSLLNIAVKYFSLVGLNEEGYYVGKICVGQNDIEKTETERKPFLEAFAFSSILEHYGSKKYNMQNAFVHAIEQLYEVNLGIDKDEKLLRAQGALFLLMRNNNDLRNMLRAEYKKQKNHLPFVLVER